MNAGFTSLPVRNGHGERRQERRFQPDMWPCSIY